MTIHPEMARSVSNIYTRDPTNFVPGMPTMAYKSPVPEVSTRVFDATSFEQQFPTRTDSMSCDGYATAGAYPSQWCQPWGGDCSLGRRVQPSRRIDPVMLRPIPPIGPPPIENTQDDSWIYIIFALLVIFFLRYS